MKNKFSDEVDASLRTEYFFKIICCACWKTHVVTLTKWETTWREGFVAFEGIYRRFPIECVLSLKLSFSWVDDTNLKSSNDFF